MVRYIDQQKHYPCELNQTQWEYIKHFVPEARHGGRPRTTNIRDVINGILYVTNTGCAWRYLPKEFPPWKTVYDYFWRWSYQGVWRFIHDSLVKKARQSTGKNETPSYLIIDTQSVKASSGESRGYDGFKKVRGRKRHILVDTMGLIHAIHLHSADLSDTKEGMKVIEKLTSVEQNNLKIMNADMGYRGSFEFDFEMLYGFSPLILRRQNTGQGKKKSSLERKHWRKTREKIKTPKRWTVERTFAWFNGYRRLSRDYEKTAQSSTMMIYMAMTQLLLRRCYA
jgi:putative transposase